MSDTRGRGQGNGGTFVPTRMSGRGYAGTPAAQRPYTPPPPQGRAASGLNLKDQLALAMAPKRGGPVAAPPPVLRGPIGFEPQAGGGGSPSRDLDGWTPAPAPGAIAADNGLGLLRSPIHGDYVLNPRDQPHRIGGGWFGAPRGTNNERPHKGHDVTAAPGTLVYPAGSGRVTFAGVMGNYGNTVEIDMGHGFRTRYAHLSNIDVKPGTFVGTDDQIGAAGTSGNAKLDPKHPYRGRPHLHWEVIRDGRPQDPYIYLGPSAYTDRRQNPEEIRRAFVD